MSQAQVRIDLGAIRHNVARLRSGTSAEVMAVVKADGYGHGMVPVARAALRAGATWLGVCTLGEALELRRNGIDAPLLAWLVTPGTGAPVTEAIAAGVDLSASSLPQLDELVDAARRHGGPARVHLKIDTGLSRSGAVPADWPALVEAAAKAQADGVLDAVGVWSHFARADEPGDPSIDAQIAEFHRALETAERHGITPRYRHMANSAATLTRPDSHFDLVRPGIAVYGLSPIPGERFGLRPAMTVSARVLLTKRVPAGTGVSYGHTHVTDRETTLAVLPMGYGDGVPRAASNAGPVRLAGRNRTVTGRVCMDQVVVNCGDDPVTVGDVAVLFGPGDHGEPTADDWAAVVGTINYEVVTRMGSARVPRRYTDDAPDRRGGGCAPDRRGDGCAPDRRGDGCAPDRRGGGCAPDRRGDDVEHE